MESDYPRGCYVYSGNPGKGAYFNKDGTGAAEAHSAPLCEPGAHAVVSRSTHARLLCQGDCSDYSHYSTFPCKPYIYMLQHPSDV